MLQLKSCVRRIRRYGNDIMCVEGAKKMRSEHTSNPERTPVIFVCRKHTGITYRIADVSTKNIGNSQNNNKEEIYYE